MSIDPKACGKMKERKDLEYELKLIMAPDEYMRNNLLHALK